MPTMQQMEVYIANSKELFDDNINVTNEGTAKFLAGSGKSLSEFVSKCA